MTDESALSRYASAEMRHLFTSQYKHKTWRKLWLALAKAQKDLGLNISQSQIDEMSNNLHTIDYGLAANHEKRLCHDVMAHIHTFAEAAPSAKGIIHLGATSAYVTDNADLIQMKEGLKLLQRKLVQVLEALKNQAEETSSLVCLSYTHLQPAQPTTMGRRFCLWLQDLLMDFKELNLALESLEFLGVKGATGTQASFLTLFEGDGDKVDSLENFIASEMGFEKIAALSGQTYTRKQDQRILNALGSLATSAHKFATDIRLLAHMGEMEEPFGDAQVGSSAMPHKRNPIRSERLCGLCRYLISLTQNPAYTAATQWLERSLDDSSNRRLCIPQAFQVADAIVNLLYFLARGLKVYPSVIDKRLREHLPFLATEHILMKGSHQGQDRGDLHELLRQKCQALVSKAKEDGLALNLKEALLEDTSLGLSEQEVEAMLCPDNFTGRSELQVQRFIENILDPILATYQDLTPLPISVEI